MRSRLAADHRPSARQGWERTVARYTVATAAMMGPGEVLAWLLIRARARTSRNKRQKRTWSTLSSVVHRCLTLRKPGERVTGRGDIPPPMIAAADEERDLRPLREAAEHARVTEATVRRWIREERIIGYGTPGRRLIDWHELSDFLRRGPTSGRWRR
jgi:hypothetical protein